MNEKPQELAAQAWDALKPDSEPTFANSTQDHKDNLRLRADGVVRTGVTVNAFEEKVKKLHAKEVTDAPKTPLGTTTVK